MVVLLVGGKGLGIGGTGSVCIGIVEGVPYVAPPLAVMPFPLLQVPMPPMDEAVVPFTLVPVPSTVTLPFEPTLPPLVVMLLGGFDGGFSAFELKLKVCAPPPSPSAPQPVPVAKTP